MAADFNPDFLCALCFRVLHDPVLHVTCSYNFCHSCFSAYTRCPQSTRCPVCLEPLIGTTRSNLALKIALGMVKVQCECGENVPAERFACHAQNCPGKTMEDMQIIAQNSIRRDRKAAPAETTSSFSCPVCSESDLSKSTLVSHILSAHKGARGVCPICASQPWGDPHFISQDLWGHIDLRHCSNSEEIR